MRVDRLFEMWRSGAASNLRSSGGKLADRDCVGKATCGQGVRQMRWICKWRAALMVIIACASSDSVFAGAWDRFDQGVDLLFDPGKVTLDARLYDLIPHRKLNTVNGIAESVNVVPIFFGPRLTVSLFHSTMRPAWRRTGGRSALIMITVRPGAKRALLSQGHLESKRLVSLAHTVFRPVMDTYE